MRAHRGAAPFVAQQTAGFAPNRRRVREWHKRSAPVSQQFGGMPIRRRITAFPAPNAYASVPDVL